MKTHRSVLTQMLLCLGLSVVTATAANFTVTNNFDSGEGTLRAAISNANASVGLDTITFAINTNTSGVQTITLSSALPAIIDPVVIDGTTQPGYSNAPVIEINGNFLSGVHGLSVAGGGSTVRALSIRNSGRSTSVATRASGILISTNGGNVVAGCYFGLNTNGVSALQNTANGITIDNSPNNVIGGTNAADRNVIGGNSQSGIQILGPGSTNNRVMGNLIGLSVPGTNAVANFNAGIFLTNVTGNVIGGTNAGARNVIARNSSVEILVQNSSGVMIAGNYIGLRADGTALSTNLASDNGISINNSSNNIVGGLVEGARNVIGNLQSGVSIFGSNSIGNVVLGNFIGTGPSGTNTVPNSICVNISTGARSNRVGGTVAGSRNFISGNRNYGVYLNSSNNLVQGNFIGVDIIGQAPPLPLPASGSGISILASGNVIGGTTPAARNVISGNRGDGIQVGSFSAVLNNIVIQGNYIGTDAGGTLAVSNRNNGITVFLNTTNCLIGGTNAGAGNVISGNGDNGVWIGAQAPVSVVRVIGNRIGFTADLKPPAPALPGPNLARPGNNLVPLPGAPFLFPLLNGQHGIRCEHADNCVFGVPPAPNLISCGDFGDCITIIDGRENDFVNNSFANYGPFQTIDNFSGTQNDIEAPIIDGVVSGLGHTIITGFGRGTPGTAVTIHLTGGPSGSSVQFPTGVKKTVTIGSGGTVEFTFDLPYENPLSGFTAFAQDAALNTSELPDPFPAVGPPGTARIEVGFPPNLGVVALDGPTTFPLPFTVVGPATANDVKINISSVPGGLGTFTSPFPFIKTADGIQISLGDLPPGTYAGPGLTLSAPPQILGNASLNFLLNDATQPLGFSDNQSPANPSLPGQFFDPLASTGDFDGAGGANDVVAMDGITGNTVVILNPTGPTPSTATVPLGDYCRQHNMHPTSVTTFRGAGGVNHFAATLISWPWVSVPTGQLVVFINQGNGNFGAAQSMRIFPASPGAIGLVNGDFNKDGVDDLVYVDPQANTAAVALNDGANFFLTPNIRETGGFAPNSVAVGDVNGDDNLDLLVVNQSDIQQGNQSIVSVLLGLGNGSLFPSSQFLPVPDTALNLVGGLEHSTLPQQNRPMVDFNGDGFPDFAVTSTRGGVNDSGQSAPSVTLILNRPDAPGTFNVIQPISLNDVFLPSGGSRVAAGDVNGDGVSDLIIAQEGSGCATLFYNQGPPGFPVPTFAQSSLSVGGANYALAVADFNSDGSPDLAVVSTAQIEVGFRSTIYVGGNAAQSDLIKIMRPVRPTNRPVMGPLLVDRDLGIAHSPPGFRSAVEASDNLISWNNQANVLNVGNRTYFPLGIPNGAPNKFFRANGLPPVP